MNLSNTGAVMLTIAILMVGIMGYMKNPVNVEVQEGGQATVQEIGAAPGSELYTDYFTVNGLTLHYRKAALDVATTSVICSLKAPSATSTLVSGGLTMTTGTTSAVSIGAVKSLLPASAGTLMATSTFAASVPASFSVAPTTTAAFPQGTMIFQPNQYLYFVVNTTAAGNVKAPGTCSAVFHTY